MTGGNKRQNILGTNHDGDLGKVFVKTKNVQPSEIETVELQAWTGRHDLGKFLGESFAKKFHQNFQKTFSIRGKREGGRTQQLYLLLARTLFVLAATLHQFVGWTRLWQSNPRGLCQ